MDRNDLLHVIAARRDQYVNTLGDRLAAAGLSPEIAGQVRDGLLLAFAGAEQALARWSPHPAPQSAEEEQSLLAALDDALVQEAEGVIAEFLKWQADVVGRTRQRLLAWNRERPVVRDQRPTKEQAKLFADEAPDRDSMRRVDDGDGRFHFEYQVSEHERSWAFPMTDKRE